MYLHNFLAIYIPSPHVAHIETIYKYSLPSWLYTRFVLVSMVVGSSVRFLLASSHLARAARPIHLFLPQLVWFCAPRPSWSTCLLNRPFSASLLLWLWRLSTLLFLHEFRVWGLQLQSPELAIYNYSPSSTRLLSLPIRSDLFPNIIIIITIIIITVESLFSTLRQSAFRTVGSSSH